jgi:xanthine dehydrogenase small subunit
VSFVLDGQVIEASAVAPTTTLLQYLRDTLGHCGTKEGCGEGDCGACTVLEGTLSGAAGHEHIEYRAVNSCIRFVPTFDGKEIVTSESLKQTDGSLHPAQQAMVDCHGSQCGFCTPGFVMSLCGLYLKDAAPEREAVIDALSGNLCRCTGYRPIIEAGCRMKDYAEPVHWSRADAQSATRIEALKALQSTESLKQAGFKAPKTLAELADLYAAEPQSLLLAGGTDIGLWVTKHMRALPPLIYLGEVAELKTISIVDGALRIPAAVALNEAYDAIVTQYPPLAELYNRFASVPIRNSGTLCGNVANGSPIGDSMPILIALGALVELRCGAETRVMPMQDLYLGYQKKALTAGEFVAAVHVPVPQPGWKVASYKISKRFDQDISAVCGGYAIKVVDGLIEEARIAYGGMAAIPQRAARTEAALIGQPFSETSFSAAQAAIALDYKPLSDMRSSASYRLEVAGNLLKRFWFEHAGTTGQPVRISMTLDALAL